MPPLFGLAVLLCPLISAAECSGGLCVVLEDETSLVQVRKTVELGTERHADTTTTAAPTELEQAQDNATKLIDAAKKTLETKESDEKDAVAKMQVQQYAADVAKLEADKTQAKALHFAAASDWAAQRQARAKRLAKKANQTATDAEAAYNSTEKAAAAAKKKADDWETEAEKRHKDAQNATAVADDAADKTESAEQAAELKAITDKAAADEKAAAAAADKAAGSRQAARDDTASAKAAVKEMKADLKTAKTDAKAEHNATHLANHAEHKAAKTAHEQAVWDAKKLAIAPANVTGADA